MVGLGHLRSKIHASEEAQHSKDEYRAPDASPSGGVLKDDEDLAERQKAFLTRTIKRLGSRFFEGKPITEISLHVSVFEPRSFLERLCDDWDFAPTYLQQAASVSDPIERIKLVAAFIVAGFHRSASLAKPFNPILGETYSAVWSDGTVVHLEQTNHHPPVTHWVARHSKGLYTFSGFGMINGKVNMLENCVKTRRYGVNQIDFADGTRITFTLPYAALRGLILGERKVEFLGSFTILYEDHNLVGDFALNPDPRFMGGLFGQSGRPSDFFKGIIYRPARSDGEKAPFSGLYRPARDGTMTLVSPYVTPSLLNSPGLERRTDNEIAESVGVGSASYTSSVKQKLHAFRRGDSGNHRGDERVVLAAAEGSYMGFLDFDGKRYWDIRRQNPERAAPWAVQERLPTDAAERLDVKRLREVLSASNVTDEKLNQLLEDAQVRNVSVTSIHAWRTCFAGLALIVLTCIAGCKGRTRTHSAQ
mmetsp:Transcript_6013/g.18121  ORF Transcript_6013/g.18121 Transcript_6013/m.18121 type:complete len:476 (+) Transcript_6013:122-1549(+)